MGASIAPFSQPPISRTYAERYGAATTFVDFRARLRCQYCGSGNVSTVVNASHATPQERWERETGEGESG